MVARCAFTKAAFASSTTEPRDVGQDHQPCSKEGRARQASAGRSVDCVCVVLDELLGDVMAEQFILFMGRAEPWIYNEVPATRDEAISIVKTGEVYPTKVIAFDIEAGTCRDASLGIATEVVNAWAHSGEPLTYKQREYVELAVSIDAANLFAEAAE